MLEWRQIQTIIEKLQGTEHRADQIHHLDEPWRSIYRSIEPTNDPVLVERALWKATAGIEGRNAIVERILRSIPGQDAYSQFESLADMAKRLPELQWIWPSWIPRGMLTLLGAAAGVGKSLVALDLARRMIHGDPFPDGSPVPSAGSPVIYVDAEAIPQIMRRRSEAWGLDQSRLYPMAPPDDFRSLDLCSEDHRDRLIQMVYDLQPHLVVIDSLGAISVRGENSIEDVRELIAFLTGLAREFDVGLLLVHHLRKRGKYPLPAGTHPVSADDFRGSSHIIAMARSVLAMSIVQTRSRSTHNAPRRLEVVKTNLCAYPPPLGLTLEEGDAGAPALRYGKPPLPYRRPTRTGECAAWLERLLESEGKPVKPADVIQLAAQSGYRRSILYRARSNLEGTVVDTDTKFSPQNRWALARPSGKRKRH